MPKLHPRPQHAVACAPRTAGSIIGSMSGTPAPRWGSAVAVSAWEGRPWERQVRGLVCTSGPVQSMYLRQRERKVRDRVVAVVVLVVMVVMAVVVEAVELMVVQAVE